MARLQITKDDRMGLSAVVPCTQCSKAPCVEICPVGANAFVPETGANVINPETCIGCQMCMMVCPFGAVLKIEKQGQRVIIKCDLCNGDPQCVKFCEPGAIRYEEPQEQVQKRSDWFAGRVLELIKEMKGMGETK